MNRSSKKLNCNEMEYSKKVDSNKKVDQNNKADYSKKANENKKVDYSRKSDHMEESKKADKKYFKRFLCILIGSFLVGGVFGFLASMLNKDGNITDLAAKFKDFSVSYFSYFGTAIILILIVLAAISYEKARKLEKELPQAEDEDEQLDRIENLLNYPMILTQAMFLFSMFFMAFMFYVIETKNFGKKDSLIMVGITLFIVFGSWAFAMTYQKLSIDMEKRLNPEKRGSIFDTNFDKKWLESCDEAQKLIVYKASFSAFKTTNRACIVVWLLAVLLELGFGAGILPVFLVCLIMMILNLSYLIASMKLEQHK